MEEMTGAGLAPKKAPAYILLWRNNPNSRRNHYGPVPGNRNNENFKLMMSKKIFVGL